MELSGLLEGTLGFYALLWEGGGASSTKRAPKFHDHGSMCTLVVKLGGRLSGT